MHFALVPDTSNSMLRLNPVSDSVSGMIPKASPHRAGRGLGVGRVAGPKSLVHVRPGRL